MRRRKYSREFKLKVVRQITTGQKRPAQVGSEYGLADSVVSRWLKEYRESGEAAFTLHFGKPTVQEQQIAELQRLCGQQAMEIDMLKKAVGSRS